MSECDPIVANMVKIVVFAPQHNTTSALRRHTAFSVVGEAILWRRDQEMLYYGIVRNLSCFGPVTLTKSHHFI